MPFDLCRKLLLLGYILFFFVFEGSKLMKKKKTLLAYEAVHFSNQQEMHCNALVVAIVALRIFD